MFDALSVTEQGMTTRMKRYPLSDRAFVLGYHEWACLVTESDPKSRAHIWAVALSDKAQALSVIYPSALTGRIDG